MGVPMRLMNVILLAVTFFSIISILFLYQHETNSMKRDKINSYDNYRRIASNDLQSKSEQTKLHTSTSKKGVLMCNGTQVDSEVIYWKVVPGDAEYESPITPHHGEHHDKYLTFEYDHGGWNNIRSSLECIVIIAHAMGRTLVVPPQQHLYLMNYAHTDKDKKEEHTEMGFEDFFDLDLLQSHKGFHVMHMREFLAKEGVTGTVINNLL